MTVREDEFEIEVSRGGHPIWCEIRVEGKFVARFNSLRLRDLEHVVGQARREARNIARRMDPERVEDY